MHVANLAGELRNHVSLVQTNLIIILKNTPPKLDTPSQEKTLPQ